MITRKKHQPTGLLLFAGGFTFVELLMAALLTGALASAVMAGLVGMLEFSQKSEARIKRQQELDRSIGFIGDEIQKASNISTTATLDASIPTTGSPAAVLQLSIPNPSAPTTPYTVIYYLRTNTATWLGPQVLYRWGPPLADTGLYTNGTPTNEALVDLIDDTLPNPNNNCPSGWTPNPPVVSRLGVYTCVDGTGKQANIVLRGQIPGAPAGNDIYEVAGQFSARSSQ